MTIQRWFGICCLLWVLGLNACGAAGGNSSGLIDALFGGASGLDSGDSSVTGDDSSSNSVEDDIESGSEDIEDNLLPPASMPIPSLTSSLTSGADADGVSWFQGSGLEDYTLVITNTTLAGSSTRQVPAFPKIKMLASIPAHSGIQSAPKSLSILETLQRLSTLVIPEVVADSGYDATDADPCNDCDPLESTCSRVCVTVDNGEVAPTVIHNYTMGDTLSFAYYDAFSLTTGEAATDTAIENVVFLDQIPASSQGMTRYNRGVAQVSSDGTVKTLSYVSGRFMPGSGNADSGYVQSRTGFDTDKLFYDPARRFFIVRGGRFLYAMQLQDDVLIPSGYDSTNVCPETDSVLTGCNVDELKLHKNFRDDLDVYYTTAPPAGSTEYLSEGKIYSLYGSMEPFTYLDEGTPYLDDAEKTISLKNVLGFALDPPHGEMGASAVVVLEDGNGAFWLLGRDEGQPLSLLCSIDEGTNIQDVVIFAGGGRRGKMQRAALVTATHVDFFNFLFDGEISDEDCQDFSLASDILDRITLNDYKVIAHSFSISTHNIFLLLRSASQSEEAGGETVAVVDLLNQRLESRLSDAIDPDHDGLIKLSELAPGKSLTFGGQSITFSIQEESADCHLVVGSQGLKSAITIPYKYLENAAPNDCGDVNGNGPVSSAANSDDSGTLAETSTQTEDATGTESLTDSDTSTGTRRSRLHRTATATDSSTATE